MNPISVEIKDVATGEIRLHKTMMFPPPDGLFIWEEGNYACDCNRAVFFDPTRSEKTACSDGRFQVRITDDAGQVVYNEFGDTP